MAAVKVTDYAPEGFALDIFRKRYALHAEETWVEACDRVAAHVASAEKPDKMVQVRTDFESILRRNLFMPGGRIWYGSGRPKGQLLNCFVIPTEDSREGWGKTVSDMIVISGTGGGLGVNASPIRPKGSPINGSGGSATGSTSLMEIINAAGDVIKAGGGRRVALMLALGLTHGDIEEFLDKKLDLKKLNNANVSVVFDDDPEAFFDLVRRDAPLELKFRGRVVATVPARRVFDKIIQNALKGGEPGILNGYLANKMNNVWYDRPLICTNPCVTGDTLIAVADGRNAVPIAQLAAEGVDVPVYSIHPGTGKVEVKLGVNPRLTGTKRPVYKLTLDDGSIVRTTGDHRFILSDMSVKEMKDLRPGDSIAVKTKWKTNWKEIFAKTNSRSSDYWAIGGAGGKLKFEHNLLAEFCLERRLRPGEVVHHRNFDGCDNSLENLQVMSRTEHDRYHGERIRGDRNPYYRMSDEWKRSFASHPGEKNGMFGRKNSWGRHSAEARVAIGDGNRGKKRSEQTKALLSQAKRELMRERYVLSGIPQHVKKTCPGCAVEFIVTWNAREQMYCSKKCFLQVFNRRKDVNDNKRAKWELKRTKKREQLLSSFTELKFTLGRDPSEKEFQGFCREKNISSRFTTRVFENFSDLKEQAGDFNHRVVSVELDGHEDVYNITVEDNHNFGIVLPVRGTTASGKEKQFHVFTPQCGEIWLAAYDCCCLGALVLPRFVVKDHGKPTRIDWSLLEQTVTASVRFLDNVLTVNNYPLPEIRQTCSDIRRIGLGIMGLHDMLLMMGMRYADPESLELIDKVMNFIKEKAYEASCELAVEKGAFPKFDAEKYLKGGFAKTLRPKLRALIREKGIRHCALLTIAPTGTTAIVCGVTSGIENTFGPGWLRRYWDNDVLREEVVINPLFRQMVESGEDVSHFQSVYDLSLRDHFEVQRVCQRHLDNACSKTINVPQGVSADELAELYMEFFPELKGVTVYPEGSRENQPIVPLPLADVLDRMGISADAMQLGGDSCRGGVCEI